MIRELDEEIRPLELVDLVRYAGASGDFNPMHFDADYARAAGSEGVFAMGMLPGGILAASAARWLGRDRLTRLELRFVERIWPGEPLRCTGRVVDETTEAHGRRVRAALELQAGRRVKVTGSCEALLPE